jgi:nitroimidazol reductase NimA-like FMN-containing flavoprotein (pyridoxamine 5'-phosphate oxidase superfamily)
VPLLGAYVSGMPKLTDAEVDAFLQEPGHLVRIGVVDDEGAPLVVPTWFIVRDGTFCVTPRERSAWFAHLRREPRICFTVDEAASPYRKVVLRGTVRVVHDVGEDDAWRDLYRDITMRYVPEEWGEAYLADTHDEPRALLGLDLAAAATTTWRMPAQPGEDPLDVWAPRYYHGGPRAGG